MHIRKATIDDLPVLLEFEQGVIAAERPYDATLKQGLIHYYDITQMIAAEDVELVVAEIDGALVGCGYARILPSKPFVHHSHYAYLGFMYVRPAYRGKGINAAIISRLKEWALSKGLVEMQLEVYDQNDAARKAYEKFGFRNHLITMRLDIGNDKQDSAQ